MQIDGSNHYFNKANENISQSLQNIASAKPTLKDNSSKMIYEKMNSDIKSISQGIQNINNNMAYLKIADGALDSIGESLSSIGKNLVQLNNASLNSSQTKMIQSEINAHKDTINQIIQSTSYNGKNILSSNSISLNDGKSNIDIKMPSLEGISDINEQNIDSFINQVEQTRISVSSATHRLTSALDNNHNSLATIAKTNESTESMLIKNITELNKAKISQQASAFAMNEKTKAEFDPVPRLFK